MQRRNRRDRWGTRAALRALAWALVPFAAACQADDNARDSPRPPRRHVVLITVDTLRSDYMSANGYDRPTTPFLDFLLSQGVQFPNTITPVPRTTPALASLLTGAYPHTTGVRTLYDRLAPGVVSLAELVRGQGYTTVAVVSNHVLTTERNLDRGFHVYDAADDSRDAAMTNDAVFHHLARYEADDALFLWVHYIDPHVPYMPPPELATAFDPDYEGRYRIAFGQEKGGVGNLAYPKDLPKAEAVYRNPLSPETNAHIRRLYAADIRSTDDAIARLVEHLHQRFGDDWLTIFTADHGESLGEHDFYYDHGDYVYNAGLQVPLAFVMPPGDRLARSAVVREPVSLVDVLPTLVALLDLQMPPDHAPQVEGRSLMPYLEGRQMPPRPVFAESGRSFSPHLVRRRVHFDVRGRFRTVALGDWKLIWTPGQQGTKAFELYNVATDPRETSDLYAPGHPQAARLKTLLQLWLRSADQEERPGPGDEDARRLRSLGYLD